MKMMIQIETTVYEAEKFIRQLSYQGYTAHRAGDDYRTDVHFTDDDTGVTTIRYAVTIIENTAFIGVRPV